MFDNIGGKVKGLAKFVCWVGIICSVIGGIALLLQSSRYNDTTVLGISVLIGGVLGSWIGSWALCAIGSAADDAAAVRTYFEITQTHGEVQLVSQKNHATNPPAPDGIVKLSKTQYVFECPKCHRTLQRDVNVCFSCGTTIVKEYVD